VELDLHRRVARRAVHVLAQRRQDRVRPPSLVRRDAVLVDAPEEGPVRLALVARQRRDAPVVVQLGWRRAHRLRVEEQRTLRGVADVVRLVAVRQKPHVHRARRAHQHAHAVGAVVQRSLDVGRAARAEGAEADARADRREKLVALQQRRRVVGTAARRRASAGASTAEGCVGRAHLDRCEAHLPAVQLASRLGWAPGKNARLVAPLGALATRLVAHQLSRCVPSCEPRFYELCTCGSTELQCTWRRVAASAPRAAG
jgi:hypothetical protein